MKICIDENKKKLLKKDAIESRISVLLFSLFFSLFYLIVYFFRFLFLKEYLPSDFSIGFFVFLLSIFGIIFNIFYVNQFFRRDYNGDKIEIDYSTHRGFLLIHNINTDKKTKVYAKSIFYIFYKKHCAVVLAKNRRMYIIPNEVNIDVLKKNTNNL